MARPSYRSAYACAAFALALAPAARAGEPPPVVVALACERAAEPGRVRCSVEAKAEPGRAITWADVQVVELPPFTSPLKARIGPQDATARDAAIYKWAFGLVARSVGQGEARVRVRAVTCAATDADGGAKRCAPFSVEVRAPVQVGG